MNWTERFIVALATVCLLCLGVGIGIAVETHTRFDQDRFPCAEDEYLGYAPQFGPDKVGCIQR